MSDATAILVAVIAAFPPTLVAGIGLYVSITNRERGKKLETKLEQVHVAVNSGLSLQLQNSRDAGKAEGKEEQKSEDKK